MKPVVISGYGKMGHMIEKELIAAGAEYQATEDVQSIAPEVAAKSVCIDFTTPAAFRANYEFLAKNFSAVVVGTTGWDDIRDDVFAAFRASGHTLVYASNFSIGVNIFFAVSRAAASLLGNAGGYSPYIVEKHHCHKLDAPSGTAKTLGAIVDAAMGGERQATDIQSVRCGEIPGIHTLCFEGLNDRITIEHEAFSRQGFAAGAVWAARLCEDKQGVYEFSDLINNTLIEKQ